MEFRDWLMQEKGYSKRASHDVESRLRRALRLVNQTAVCTDTAAKMEENETFKQLSINVKSQMRRSLHLQKEYSESITNR